MGDSDGCDEKYICASTLCLMSVMLRCYSVITDRGTIAPVHGKRGG